MKQQINEMEINGIVYVPKDSIKTTNMADNLDGMPFVLIRTYSAGVHFGYLKSKESLISGVNVVLINSRNIFYWNGAAGISQIATIGVSKPDDCKFTMVVPERELTQVIEIIPITEIAKLNLEKVKVWQK